MSCQEVYNAIASFSCPECECEVEVAEVQHLLDLLKRMLHLDAGQSITPQNMMKHPFSLTACHVNTDHSSTSP
ncbi:unnamed protein product [Lota lota]